MLATLIIIITLIFVVVIIVSFVTTPSISLIEGWLKERQFRIVSEYVEDLHLQAVSGQEGVIVYQDRAFTVERRRCRRVEHRQVGDPCFLCSITP